MCGIVGCFTREGVVDKDVIKILFKHNEKRGRDGWGYAVCDTVTGNIMQWYKTAKAFSEDRVEDALPDTLYHRQLLIGICRAKPETEVETREEDLDRTMQPIIRDDCILVHNGSINTYYDNCESWKETDIDSECIIYQYRKRGFPKFVEHIPGGFAFILFDQISRQLVVGVNHMPLYHMYIKGIGYFISSVKEALDEILDYYYHVKHDGLNLWEAWYHTEVTAFTVRQIDLDSGMDKWHTFKPLYLLPNEKIS